MKPVNISLDFDFWLDADGVVFRIRDPETWEIIEMRSPYETFESHKALNKWLGHVLSARLNTIGDRIYEVIGRHRAEVWIDTK